MKNSKNSVLKLGRRKPYEPISRVFDLPPALFEMSTLLRKAEAGDADSLQKAIALQESIISTALDNPSCVSQIQNLLSNGYELEFSLVQNDKDEPKTTEEVSSIAS